MNDQFRISTTENKMMIEICPSSKTIIKIVKGFVGFLSITFALSLIVFLFYFHDFDLFIFAIPFVSALFLIIGRNYLRDTIYQECVELMQNELLIKNKYLDSTKTVRVKISEILSIDLASKRKISKGVFLIEAGTIGIICKNGTIRFGKNIGTWDAQKIINKIKSYIDKQNSSR